MTLGSGDASILQVESLLGGERMREIRLQGQIGDDHTLHLTLPNDVCVGPAEVLVRVPGNGSDKPRESHREMLERIRRTIKKKRSWKEIQRTVEEERKSWD